jgi:fluoride ion exporter CrcB/FEX
LLPASYVPFTTFYFIGMIFYVAIGSALGGVSRYFLYVTISVLLSLAATFLGIALSREVFTWRTGG